MVHHIVMWDFIDTLTQQEKDAAGEKIKKLLEDLKGKVEGLEKVEVITAPLASSNRDIALISILSSEEALSHYQTHPDHVAAGQFIKQVTCHRTCFDYIV